MRITLWKGHHGPEVRELVREAWNEPDRLLILCPPTDLSFDFLCFLPEGDIDFRGDWETFPALPTARATVDYPAAPVLGLFTTGTSGPENKLVLYSHDNIRTSLHDILEHLPADRLEAVFSYPQPFHTFGLLLGYVLALEMGWELWLADGKYGSHFHQARLAVPTSRLLTLGTPTHFRDLLSFATAEGVSLSSTEACVVGGASVSVDLWRRLRDDLNIVGPSVGYGCTEASPGVAHLPAGRPPREDGEIGFPLRRLKLQLAAGQGYSIGGPSVCMAMVFSDRVEFPRELMIADDLELRSDGVLLFRGRTDLVLNRGGEKFSLESIERCVSERFSVDVLAFNVPDARLGFDLGLLLQADIPVNDIVDLLSQRFRVKFDPRHFRKVSRFPMNASHKPDRRAALDFSNGQVTL